MLSTNFWLEVVKVLFWVFCIAFFSIGLAVRIVDRHIPDPLYGIFSIKREDFEDSINNSMAKGAVASLVMVLDVGLSFWLYYLLGPVFLGGLLLVELGAGAFLLTRTFYFHK